MNLPYIWSFLCANMMRTKLGVDIESCGAFGVSSCDITQGVNRVKVVDPMIY
jgi:hypothetical protein